MTDEIAGTAVMPPAAGPQVPAQTKVALLVSKGPAEAPVPSSDVPDVVGTRQAEALEILQDAGLPGRGTSQPERRFKEGTLSPTSFRWAGAPRRAARRSASSRPPDLPPRLQPMTSLPDAVGSPRGGRAAHDAAGLTDLGHRGVQRDRRKGSSCSRRSRTGAPTTGCRPKKSMAWLWAILALIAVAIAAYFLFFTAEDVTVPDVTGMTLENAELALADAGLEVGRVTEEATEDAEANTVLSQTPPANEVVAEGSRVDLVVASAVEGVEVPDVVGLSLDDATATLEDAGLTVRSEEVFSDDVEAGLVTAQSPQPGTRVESGAEVALSVSKGPEPAANVTVPDLSGMTRADAEAALDEAGLGVRVVQMNSDTVPRAASSPRRRRRVRASRRARWLPSSCRWARPRWGPSTSTCPM
jgi:beta-lactam-binding protein with PASTA domain